MDYMAPNCPASLYRFTAKLLRAVCSCRLQLLSSPPSGTHAHPAPPLHRNSSLQGHQGLPTAKSQGQLSVLVLLALLATFGAANLSFTQLLAAILSWLRSYLTGCSFSVQPLRTREPPSQFPALVPMSPSLTASNTRMRC